MKKFGYVSVAIFSFAAQSAMADLLSLANGRTANMDNMADISVEAGANYGADISLLGLRANYKASPNLVVFGDVGRFASDQSYSDSDGFVYGLGAFYQFRNMNLLENTEFAVKGAYHIGKLDYGSNVGANGNFYYTEIAVEVLISGDQLSDTELGWYTNAGLHNLDFEAPGSVGENKFTIGVGITGPLSFGEYFAGIDFIKGANFVAGVRYNL